MKTLTVVCGVIALALGIAIWNQRRALAAVPRHVATKPSPAPADAPATHASRSSNGGAEPAVAVSGEGEAKRNAAEIGSWLTAYKALKQAAAEHPEWTIPEMGLLSETDWLGLSHSYSPINDDAKLKQALAAFRTAAKIRFATQVSEALKRFSDSNGGKLPASVTELNGLLGPGIAPEWLSRYRQMRTGLAKDVPPGTPVLLEATPVDPTLDQRIGIPARGGGPTFASWQQDANRPSSGGERTTGAATGPEGQSSTNPESPAGAVSDGVKAAVTAYRQDHGGLDPMQPQDLLPYAADDATRAEIRQAQARKAGGR